MDKNGGNEQSGTSLVMNRQLLECPSIRHLNQQCLFTVIVTKNKPKYFCTCIFKVTPKPCATAIITPAPWASWQQPQQMSKARELSGKAPGSSLLKFYHQTEDE